MDVAVWIDSDHAKVLTLNGKDTGIKRFRLRKPLSTLSRLFPFQMEDQESRRFCAQIVDTLRNAKKILIFGPGIAKHHFHTHLLEHYPLISKQIIGLESMDYSDDEQLIAQASQLFASHSEK